MRRNYKQEYGLKRMKYKPVTINLKHETYKNLLEYHVPISRLITELIEWAKDKNDILSNIRGEYYAKLLEKTTPTETQINEIYSEAIINRNGGICNNDIS